MGQYEYSYSNQKRDLTDQLSTVIAKAPKFISLFGVAQDAIQRKHEWLEDQIAPRSITVVSISTLTITASEADVARVLVGTTLNVQDDPALFKVTSKPSTTTFIVALAAANGSSTTAPSADDVMNIVSTPMPEGSDNSDAEQQYRESDTAYNQMQIFRKLVQLTRTSMGIGVYGIENSLATQEAFAMQQIARDMSRAALLGARVAGTSSVLGSAGGLYTFASSLEVDASSTTLDNYLINDAAQSILAQGGMPSVILCSPGQARVISAINADKVQVMQAAQTRGEFVTNVVNDISGASQIVIGDYDVPDTQAWVLDPAGFAISYLTNGRMADSDTTSDGFDGIQRTILGELTFEFKNANQRCCKIDNLTASATALASIRSSS